jgi:O-antigen/teichoic acid export membrane protein
MINKTIILGKKFIGHELVSGTAFVFIGSITGNVLAFFLNLFLARSLSYADYAIFASLLSVIALASIPAGSISTVIVKFATRFFSRNETEKAEAFYKESAKLILLIGAGIFIGFAAIAIPLKNFLHIDSIWYILLVGLNVAFVYFIALNAGFLQSLLKFAYISYLNVAGNLAKLLFGILFVILGFKAFAGLLGIFAMSFIVFVLGFLPLRFLFQKKSIKKEEIPKKEIFTYAIPASIAVIALTSLTSIDVILVKHFFPAHEAGFYAGLSLIGKVIFYFTAPIPLVMFPLIVKRHSIGKNYINLLYLALLLVFIPSFAVTLFYFLFPNLVVGIFLGGRDYQEIAQYLGMFGIFITIFSMLNVCVNFFLSIGNIKATSIIIFGAILQIILLVLFHANFAQVIQISIAVCFMVLVGFLWIFYRLSKSL